MFTKEHYEKVADTLSDADANLSIVFAFVRMFQKDNPKFNSTIFFDAMKERWWKKI